MSKATFYRIPVRTTKKYAPRRRNPSAPMLNQESGSSQRVIGVVESRPAPNRSPQFHRNGPLLPRSTALFRTREPK